MASNYYYPSSPFKITNLLLGPTHSGVGSQSSILDEKNNVIAEGGLFPSDYSNSGWQHIDEGVPGNTTDYLFLPNYSLSGFSLNVPHIFELASIEYSGIFNFERLKDPRVNLTYSSELDNFVLDTYITPIGGSGQAHIQNLLSNSFGVFIDNKSTGSGIIIKNSSNQLKIEHKLSYFYPANSVSVHGTKLKGINLSAIECVLEGVDLSHSLVPNMVLKAHRGISTSKKCRNAVQRIYGIRPTTTYWFTINVDGVDYTTNPLLGSTINVLSLQNELDILFGPGNTLVTGGFEDYNYFQIEFIGNLFNADVAEITVFYNDPSPDPYSEETVGVVVVRDSKCSPGTNQEYRLDADGLSYGYNHHNILGPTNNISVTGPGTDQLVSYIPLDIVDIPQNFSSAYVVLKSSNNFNHGGFSPTSKSIAFNANLTSLGTAYFGTESSQINTLINECVSQAVSKANAQPNGIRGYNDPYYINGVSAQHSAYSGVNSVSFTIGMEGADGRCLHLRPFIGLPATQLSIISRQGGWDVTNVLDGIPTTGYGTYGRPPEAAYEPIMAAIAALRAEIANGNYAQLSSNGGEIVLTSPSGTLRIDNQQAGIRDHTNVYGWIREYQTVTPTINSSIDSDVTMTRNPSLPSSNDPLGLWPVSLYIPYKESAKIVSAYPTFSGSTNNQIVTGSSDNRVNFGGSTSFSQGSLQDRSNRPKDPMYIRVGAMATNFNHWMCQKKPVYNISHEQFYDNTSEYFIADVTDVISDELMKEKRFVNIVLDTAGSQVGPAQASFESAYVLFNSGVRPPSLYVFAGHENFSSSKDLYVSGGHAPGTDPNSLPLYLEVDQYKQNLNTNTLFTKGGWYDWQLPEDDDHQTTDPSGIPRPLLKRNTLYISGERFYNSGDINLHIHGRKRYDNNNLFSPSYSGDMDWDNPEIQEYLPDKMPFYIFSDIQSGNITTETNLFIQTRDPEFSNNKFSLFVCNQSGNLNNNVMLSISGQMDGNDNILNLYTYGEDVYHDSMNMSVFGGVSHGADMYIEGFLSQNKQLPLYLFNKMNHSGDTPLYIKGGSSAGANIFIEGQPIDKYEDSAELFTVGGNGFSRVIDLYISGAGTPNETMNLFMEGNGNYDYKSSSINFLLRNEKDINKGNLNVDMVLWNYSSGIVKNAPLFIEGEEGFHQVDGAMSLYINRDNESVSHRTNLVINKSYKFIYPNNDNSMFYANYMCDNVRKVDQNDLNLNTFDGYDLIDEGIPANDSDYIRFYGTTYNPDNPAYLNPCGFNIKYSFIYESVKVQEIIHRIRYKMNHSPFRIYKLKVIIKNLVTGEEIVTNSILPYHNKFTTSELYFSYKNPIKFMESLYEIRFEATSLYLNNNATIGNTVEELNDVDITISAIETEFVDGPSNYKTTSLYLKTDSTVKDSMNFYISGAEKTGDRVRLYVNGY